VLVLRDHRTYVMATGRERVTGANLLSVATHDNVRSGADRARVCLRSYFLLAKLPPKMRRIFSPNRSKKFSHA